MLKGLIPALFLSLSLATSQNLIVLNKSENTAMFFNLKNDSLISQLQTGETLLMVNLHKINFLNILTAQSITPIRGSSQVGINE